MSAEITRVVMHTCEAALILALAIAVAHFFPEQRYTVLLLVGSLLAATVKGARELSSVPINDYVNNVGEDAK